ncbi:MAG: T9SS type A sorting domain-containing protein [Saprospiraceae bacterium]|nr:T9SS type A sorting domain-containing protein [Saprospiraceae bacterium]
MKFYYLFIYLLIFSSLSGQDTYHQELLQQLKSEFGLDNVSFVLFDDEVNNINTQYTYGNISIESTPVNNFNFSYQSTINVTRPGTDAWNTAFGTKNQNTIEKDELILVTFWAKKNSEDSELLLFAEHTTSYDKEFYLTLNLTQDWNQYFISFKSSQRYPVSGLQMGIHLATLAQNFDIGGYTALNLGTGYNLEDLPSSFTASKYGGYEENASWRADAASRIENLRKADLNINVVDQEGNPIEDAKVKIEMLEHDFGFGSALVACRFPGNNCYDATYVEKVTNLDGRGHGFNVGVTENALKWDAWEEEWLGTPQQTINAIQWLIENGIDMRGHTLFWPGFRNMPDDINQNKNNLPYIRTRLLERMEEMLSDPTLSTLITEWDVLNEITTNRDLEEIFKADPDFTTGREIYQEIFSKSKELNPDLKIYVNDYIVLSGGGSGQNVTNRYEGYLVEMQENDVSFDGIGFQCHIGSQPTSILKIEKVLDQFYEKYNKRIKITEFDISPMVHDSVQAKYISDFLTMIYSHPAVDAFLMWGFWDGNHWKNNAPIFNHDWSVKPSGQAFIDKVYDEWWTDESKSSDSNGKVNFRAFKGKYKVTVTTESSSRQSEVDLSSPQDIQIMLDQSTSISSLNPKEFLIAPNPISEGYFFVQFPSQHENLDIQLYTSTGIRIKHFVNVNSNERLHLTAVPGIYLVAIKSGSGIVVKKLIISGM